MAAKRDFSVVGKSVPRYDAIAKVKGEMQYTDDITLPGMVYGKIKRSTIAHGRIKRIHYDAALKLPGVLTIITGEDAPKPFCVMPHMPTEYALALDKVHYFGEPVAAVAAIDEETASKALEYIQVEYEELPVLVDPFKAMGNTDVLIHDSIKGNIHFEGNQEYGEAEKALESSHLVVENSYSSSYVNHAFLEPHSAIASYDVNEKHLKVICCNQLPHYLQRTLSHLLEIPMEKIQVSIPAVGGGFGGKTEAANSDLVAALLSRKLGRPVKVTYERSEVFAQNKGRHPCHIHLKMGFDSQGMITAVDFDNTLDGGAHTSWGVIVLFFTAALLHLPYEIPEVRFRGRRIYTNKPTCGAQRGLGGVQVKMAVESLLDEAADALGMSPYELRKKNAVDSGYTAKSNIHVPHTEYKKCLDTVVERSGYLEKHKKLPFGHGVGLAGAHYSSGGSFLLYKSYKPHSTVIIRVDTEAGVTMYTGATDIGQGSNTVLAQMVAEGLGLKDISDINVVSQDTTLAPFDQGTFDSRVTYGNGQAVGKALEKVREQLFHVIGAEMGVRADQLECKDGYVYSLYEPEKRMEFKKAVLKCTDVHGPIVGCGHYSPPRNRAEGVQGGLTGPSPTFGFTAQVVELKVDLDTGAINIIKFYEAGDCGQPINPISVEGQVEGAIQMGIGQALYEELLVGEDGRLLNDNLREYKMPTSMDMPEIDTVTVDSFDPNHPFGAKECGEGPTCPVIPAILNAIYDAIGIRFTKVPVTPEIVLRALGKV